jgi:hypothetical protein
MHTIVIVTSGMTGPSDKTARFYGNVDHKTIFGYPDRYFRQGENPWGCPEVIEKRMSVYLRRGDILYFDMPLPRSSIKMPIEHFDLRGRQFIRVVSRSH